ncbi:MAG: TonB-dependent receptor [Pseudomonadota bacterium]
MRTPLFLSTILASTVPLLVPSLVLAQETEDAPQDQIVVQGFKRDYLDSGSKTAVGLDLSTLETPASVSVISQDLLRDQQVNNVDDALRNVAGVTKFKTGNGGEEKFSIRGFDASQSIYRDRARINNALNASNIPSTETANIERIEVLKGPSALLYGQGQPGGIINYVTKRPQFDEAYGLELIGGSFDFFKVEGDATGALISDKLAYRLVAAYVNSGGFRDEVERERLLINPSLLFQPTDSLRLTVGYEYIDDQYTQDRGQVLDGNSVDGYFYSDRQDETQFYGIPNWNRNTEAEARRFYAIGEADIIEGWRAELTYSRTDNDKTNVDSSPSFIDFATGAVIGAVGTPVENLVAIQPRQTIGTGETQQVTFKNFIDFEDPAGFEHQILASYTFEDFGTESTSFRGRQFVGFNVATGEYSTLQPLTGNPAFELIQVTDTVAFELQDRGSSINQEFREHGINVLDYITVNDWLAVLVGGRYSDFRDTTGDGFEDTDFAFRGGVVVSPTDNSSVYFSFSEGYTPSGGLLGIDDGPIDPQTSRSFELGGKLELRDEQLLITAAVFDVELRDVPLVVNPFDDMGMPTLPEDIRFDNVGETRTRGAEIEVVGQITDRWRVQAGYAYLDNEITASGTGQFGVEFVEGTKLPGIAEHNFNLFTFYEIPLADGDLGLGGGVFAQSDVFISTENNAEYDGWVQTDLAAYYRRERWKLQINASNIFDVDYRLAQAGTNTDSFAAIRVGTNAPRTIIGSVAFAF